MLKCNKDGYSKEIMLKEMIKLKKSGANQKILSHIFNMSEASVSRLLREYNRSKEGK